MHGVCRVIIPAVLPVAHGGSVSAGWLDVDLARRRRDRSIEQPFLRHHPVYGRVLVVWKMKERIYNSGGKTWEINNNRFKIWIYKRSN